MVTMVTAPFFPLRCLALPRPSVALLSPADKNAQLLLAWLPGQGPGLQASGRLSPPPPRLQGGPRFPRQKSLN